MGRQIHYTMFNNSFIHHFLMNMNVEIELDTDLQNAEECIKAIYDWEQDLTKHGSLIKDADTKQEHTTKCI